MNDLNPEQKKAVEHTGSPLLIIAGAGTGKTTVITKKIAWLVEQDLAKSDEILALTFTEKAANEMQERVDRLMPYGYVDMWVMTFHGFCEKVLERHALDIGLSTNFKILNEYGQWALIKKNLDKFDLHYYRPLGNPTKFIAALVKHFSRAKDEDIAPADYLKYAEELRENVDSMLSGGSLKRRGNSKFQIPNSKKNSNLKFKIPNLPDADEEVTPEIAEQEVARINEVANAYHVYQQLLLDNNALDFGDLINYTLKLFRERPGILAQFQKQFKHVLVDEFQDTNWAQYELIKLLKPAGENLTVVGDDDQCLPGDTLVVTKDGEKRIDKIKSGETVATAVGRGYASYSTVGEVRKTTKQARLLTFVTESGRKLTVTDNHKLFCYVPANSRILGREHQQFYYVYLMHKQTLGWRMGITCDLAVRLKLERSADKLVAVAAFTTEREARYHETLWSLRYGIPTGCFQERDGILMTKEYSERLYRDIDVDGNVERFARDCQIDLDAHQVALDAVFRGDKVRLKVCIELCHRQYRSKSAQRGWLQSPQVLHALSMETSHAPTLTALRALHLPVQPAKKGGRVRITSTDITELGRIARMIQEKTGAIVENVMRAGTENKQHKKANVIVATNVFPGMFVPVLTARGIIYEQVISRSITTEKLPVYDLEVEKTHNFIANGVVVHNSIFRFRGASMSNILQFHKDFPAMKEVVLTQNYRSAQNILDAAYEFIKLNNPNRLEYQLINGKKPEKRLLAQTDEAGVIEVIQGVDLDDEVQRVVEKIAEIKLRDDGTSPADGGINWNDFAILVRANASAGDFIHALERAGIPQAFLASKGLYSRPVVMDVIAYLNLLDNYHESTSLYRVLNIPVFAFTHEEIMGFLSLARKKSWSVYEALKYLSGFSKASGEKIKRLLSLIDKHTALAANKAPGEVMVTFLQESGYLIYVEQLADEALKKEILRELDAFMKCVKEFERESPDASVKNFLFELSLELESGAQGNLAMDPQAGPDMVKILTVHAAKGLEFKYVFVVNMVELRFPTTERKDPIALPDALTKEIVPAGDTHLEEERRLLYVAMTRARRGLYFSWSSDYGGARSKKPSRFLAEAGLVPPGAPQAVLLRRDFNPPPIRPEKPKPVYELPKFYSYTQLQSYRQCPYSYYVNHVLKIPKPGKYVFSFGQTMHLTLQKFFAHVMAGQTAVQASLFSGTAPAEKDSLSLEMLLRLYEESWIGDWYTSKKDRDEYFKKGKKQLKIFYEKHRHQWPKVIGLEQGFRVRIGGYTLYGKIDRLDDWGESGVQIVDYKTTNLMGTAAPKVETVQKYQLLLYQLAAQEVLRRKPANLQFYFLDNNSEFNFLGTDKDLEKMRSWVTDTIHQIEESIKTASFPHNPHCFCSHVEEIGTLPYSS